MKSKKKEIKSVNTTPIFFLVFLLIISISVAQQISSANYKIPRESIDSGGGNFSSNNYFLELSTEPIGGNISSSNYAVCVGLNCCPGDAVARFVNSSIDESASTATIAFSLYHTDLCMGTTNVTVQCAVNCNPCTQVCSVSTSRHTLTLTDVTLGSNTISITSPNSSNPIYCQVTDDTFQLQSCFNSPTNLTVTVEAGGPYTGSSAIVLVAGNTTFSDGTVVSGVSITVDLFRKSNIADKLFTVVINTSKNGKYFATFGNLDPDSYQVNVSARFESVRANATDTFDIINPLGNCQIKTIILTGKALDATTGLRIPAGGVSVTILETGDKKDGTVTDGAWSVSMVTCVVSGSRYTATVKITDNQGKISWSEIQFAAP